MPDENSELVAALARRLPSVGNDEISRLASAYLAGVARHAVDRTTGRGPVPTTLATERAAMLTFVCREIGRLLNEDEIAALLRIPSTSARSVQKNMLAVYDDLPDLALKDAFKRATRDGRGSQGEIKDGYRIKFKHDEDMQLVRAELDRRGHLCEVMESTGSRHILLIDPEFPLDQFLPASSKGAR